MSGIGSPGPNVLKKKKEKKEIVRKRTFITWSCSQYFDIEVDSYDNATIVTCKICTLYLPQFRVESRGRELHGTVSAVLLRYADSLDPAHKKNIDKHGKSGEQHDSSVWKFNNSFVIESFFHVSA